MRQLALIIMSVALIACGQPSAPAAAQVGAPAANAEADYVRQCTAGMVAQNARATEWAPAQCQQQWEAVVAAGPMADIILAAIPASGAAADPVSLRGRLTAVRWDARAEGTLIASGRLGTDLSMQVDRAGPSINFYWSEAGAMIPYDILGALRIRGAEATMVGCYALGMGENNESYRVVVPNRAPFALSVYGRMAPTANANSFYNVGAALSGQVKTLAELRREDSSWNATCG